jgi:conjugative transposon TraM protein
LNLELPDAQFKNDRNDWDKLSLYQKAQRDSMRFNEARRIDPYFKFPSMATTDDTVNNGQINTSLGTKDHSVDGNTERVNKKLKELYKALDTSSNDPENARDRDASEMIVDRKEFSDVDRLEGMMQMMQASDGSEKEMKEIQSVLDKILDIQHPQRVQEKIREQSIQNPEKTYALETVRPDPIRSMTSQENTGDTAFTVDPNAFNGISQSIESASSAKTIQAVIPDAQSLVSGSTVKLRLSQDVYISGSLISAGQFIYGVCALNGERLSIAVSSIQSAQAIFPISLSVYDLDGIEGIYVPGAIARDVAKQSSNQALQDIQLNSLNPSLELQAASTGIETVKSLISKRSRLIKVSVKAGYKVLLVDIKNQ